MFSVFLLSWKISSISFVPATDCFCISKVENANDDNTEDEEEGSDKYMETEKGKTNNSKDNLR
jgi:hypothetical protein